MKSVVSLAGAVGVLASLGIVAFDDPDVGLRSGDPGAGAPDFTLTRPGRPDLCPINKGDQLEPGRYRLQLGEKCAALLPALADVRYWSETADGGVALLRKDGQAVVEFFASDGVAYESFRPSSPFLSLLSAP